MVAWIEQQCADLRLHVSTGIPWLSVSLPGLRLHAHLTTVLFTTVVAIVDVF